MESKIAKISGRTKTLKTSFQKIEQTDKLESKRKKVRNWKFKSFK